MWPCQSIEFLDKQLNCERSTIHVYVPTGRLRQRMFQILLRSGQKLTYKGKTQSQFGWSDNFYVVIGSVSQLVTNCLSIDTLTSFSWNSMIYLSEESIIQISFRKNTLEKINGREIKCISGSSRIVTGRQKAVGYMI